MNATRREFLALTATGGLTGCAFGFPLPLPRAAVPQPLHPPSDALPPLPDGAIRRLGSRRLRTSKTISRIQFAPHGRIIVAADRDEIRGWDVATARPIFSMPYPERVDLNSGRVTNRDALVTLARVDGAAKYEIHHYAYTTGHAEIRAGTEMTRVDNAAFTADGKRIAGLCEGKLHLCDGHKTRELWTAAIASDEQRGAELCFLDGEKLLAVTTSDGLRIFEVETGKEREPLKSEPRAKRIRGRSGAAIVGIVASPGGEFLAGIGGANRDRILVWNAAKGELIRTLEESEPGSLLGFAPDGGTLYVNREGGVRAYNLATGKVLRTLDIGPNRAPQLSPDGTILATSANDALLFFDALTGQPHALSADPPGLPTKLHYVGPHTLVGLLMEYGGWIQWDLASGTSRLLRPKTLGDGLPLAISDDARIALVSSGDKLRRWDLVTGEELASVPYSLNRSVPLAHLSRNGQRIVAADVQGLKVWNGRSGTPLPLIPAGVNRDDADAIAISADSGTVALVVQMPELASRRSIVEIYSLRAERITSRFAAEGPINTVVLSPDGSRIAVIFDRGWDGRGGRSLNMVMVHDARTGGIVLRVPHVSSDLKAFAISPDNRLLALATHDRRLEVWELPGGERRLNFKLPGEATSLAFAPDSVTLAVAGSGGPVLIWDLRGRNAAKPAKPDAATCAKLLERLAGKDGLTAYEALRLVAAWPEETLPVLAKAIPAVTPPDAAKIRECIEKLDAAAFAERDKATRELIGLGELAAPSLNATLSETASAEVRTRAETILSRCGGSAPDLRIIRAVEAAEWAATAQAKHILKEWAGGAAGAKLTEEAKAALRRMGT